MYLLDDADVASEWSPRRANDMRCSWPPDGSDGCACCARARWLINTSTRQTTTHKQVAATAAAALVSRPSAVADVFYFCLYVRLRDNVRGTRARYRGPLSQCGRVVAEIRKKINNTRGLILTTPELNSVANFVIRYSTRPNCNLFQTCVFLVYDSILEIQVDTKNK